jgi:hypothetical protein
MPLPSLNAVLKWHEPIPGVRLALLPYIPFAWHKQRDALAQHIESTGAVWDGSMDTFVISVPLIKAVEAAEGIELPAWAAVLVDFLRSKSGDIVTDWHLFEEYASGEAINALWDSYEATRDTLPKANIELQKGMPIPVDEDGNENPITLAGGDDSETMSYPSR